MKMNQEELEGLLSDIGCINDSLDTLVQEDGAIHAVIKQMEKQTKYLGSIAESLENLANDSHKKEK